MAKRKARSQTDHEKSRINLTPVHAGGVQHVVGKLSTRATNLVRPHPDRRSAPEVIVPQSCGTPNFGDFGTPIWESWNKKPFGCHSRGVVQSILYGGRWWLPLSLGRGESCESKVARGLF